MTQSSRVARIIRQRRKQRQKRAGNAATVTRQIGCLLGIILIAGILLSTGAAGTGVLIYAGYAEDLPDADEIVEFQRQTFKTTVIYDRTGQHEIYEVIDPLGGDRRLVALDEVPEHFLQATIAIEDASFYDNPGFDIEGMLRALWVNFNGGEIQGGSTITQQLVKNTVIPLEERDDVSVDRKAREIILATELSRLYSKDKILEMYINTNFYGNLAYGIEAAARVYFNKSASELSLAESATLAAIPQFPRQNPLDNSAAAKERQRLVLDAMVREGYITRQEADAAFAESLVIFPFNQRFADASLIAPHFSLYARQEAEQILNDIGLDGARMISRDGLRIYTTLDLDLQQQFECLSRTHIRRLSGADPNFVHNTATGQSCTAAEFLPPVSDNLTEVPTVTNAAGIVMKARTGEIVAMLGSVDFRDESIDGNFNIATSAERQPASTFKPFVYLTAFFTPINNATVVTPATMTYDVETEFNNGTPEPYIPQNIDFQFHGPVSVREALARSYNVPAVQVLNWVGIGQVLRTAHLMGINSMDRGLSAYGLSLALGTAEASLLDMTYAYNVMNNMGYMVGTPVRGSSARAGFRQLNPVSVLRIETSEGETLWEYGREQGTFDRRSVLEPGIAYMITDILSDNEARISASFPRDNALELTRPAAVKTGTSDNFRDSWTIGYTPQYTTGVWAGNNDNTPMQGVTGLVGAAPIWHGVMEYMHSRDALPVEAWERPETIVDQSICMWSGLRPTSACPQNTEIFYYNPRLGVDYRPQQPDTYWQEIRINSCNNTLATVYSPPECVEEQSFFIYPPELQEWARTAPGVVFPPEDYDIAGTYSDFSQIVITEPAFLNRISGQVEIRGNASDDNFDYFSLEWGTGNDPDRWERITDRQTEDGRDIVLGEWDTRNQPDGLYTLRLTVVRTDRSFEQVYQQVTIDNTAPTIRLVEPVAGNVYSASEDSSIELISEPADNYQVSHVEFYRDGERVGEVTDAPYTFNWSITGTGTTTFTAIVVDEAGNTTESNQVSVQLAP